MLGLAVYDAHDDAGTVYDIDQAASPMRALTHPQSGSLAAGQASPQLISGRSFYIDTLRAAAIVRVYLGHTLWLGWLTVIYPSMSVMFALGGTLMAASLERRGPGGTVTARLRRLLLPLWVLAAVAVPLLLAHGWQPAHWAEPLYWIMPLANPPAGEWTGGFTLALWYLRAYLWFVLLSAPLWWAFRRWPVVTLITPLCAAAVMYSPLVTLPVNRATDVLWSTAAYGTCWMLGFARHTRALDRIPLWACAAAAAVLGSAGFWWGSHLHGPAAPLADPLADMLWGTAFVLILMRLRPTLGFLQRVRPLAGFVATVNARAVTIYIWHLPMLFAAAALVAAWDSRFGVTSSEWAHIIAGTILTAAIVLAIGWVEDIAARRPMRLNPATSARTPAGQRTPT